MNLQESLAALDRYQRKTIAYRHALDMIYYDGVTVAPEGSAANRGESMSILSEELYALTTSPQIKDLLDSLWEQRGALDEAHFRMVFLLRKSQAEMEKIPVDEYVAYQKLVNESEAVWHRAKQENDFASLVPYLDRIVHAQRRFAGYVKPGMDPYDYCLDNYEEGLRRDACDAFFTMLRAELVPQIHKVCASSHKPDTSLLHIHAPIEKQRILSDALMNVLGMDLRHCALGETEHPFTTGFTKYDARITTHYYEDNFSSSMFSVVHECGHALYDMGVRDEFAYTCLGSGVSMAVHESQSRFFENIIGRSRAFISHMAPKLRELFPELAHASNEALYGAFNESHPSFIRTEADELTYCLHIMVRYELEKALFDGRISAADLPREWNRLYREYLEIDVPDDRQGVLQDSHWFGGLFGYFPSYALGSAYGAQLLKKMEETTDVFGQVALGNLAPVRDWLQEHIWQYGQLYAPKVLMEQAFGGPFDPSLYVDYLTRKYTDLYAL